MSQNMSICYKMFIRWKAPAVRSGADAPLKFDGDPCVFDSPLEIKQRLEACRNEADRRLQIDAAFGAVGYEVILETVSSVVLDSYTTPSPAPPKACPAPPQTKDLIQNEWPGDPNE